MQTQQEVIQKLLALQMELIYKKNGEALTTKQENGVLQCVIMII